MATVRVVVSVIAKDEGEEVNWGIVNSGLRNAGLDIRRTVEADNKLVGIIDDAQIDQAEAVPYVEGIEIDRVLSDYEL